MRRWRLQTDFSASLPASAMDGCRPGPWERNDPDQRPEFITHASAVSLRLNGCVVFLGLRLGHLAAKPRFVPSGRAGMSCARCAPKASPLQLIPGLMARAGGGCVASKPHLSQNHASRPFFGGTPGSSWGFCARSHGAPVFAVSDPRSVRLGRASRSGASRAAT